MAIAKSDVLRFASSQGLGSALANSSAGFLSSLAQAVRHFAAQKSAEAQRLAESSAQQSTQLAGAERVDWQGKAAAAYRAALAIEQKGQTELTQQIESAAQLILTAGESLASEIDQLAQGIASAASVVDGVLGVLAETAEKVDDILEDTVLRSAQEQLEELVGNPLVRSVQQGLWGTGY